VASSVLEAFAVTVLSVVDTNCWCCIREENLLQMVLWKTVHFALFLVKISINFSPGYSTVFFFSSQCTSLLYNNFKILLQKFQNFCTMF
jgi:hypothetical protein